MRLAARTLALVILGLLFTASVKAQQDEVTIDKRRNGATAAPGQMLLVFLSKSSERLIPPPPLNHFEVLVIQDGITYVAQVRSVTSGLMPAKAAGDSAPSGKQAPDLNQQAASGQSVPVVIFTVPPKLHEGAAVAIVNYRGRRRDEFKFKVANQPPPPHIMIVSKVVTALTGRADPSNSEAIDKRPSPTLSFERGEETIIHVSPLIDPETPDAAVLVTFKQGNVQREVEAEVIRHEAVDMPDPGVITFSPVLYEVRVKAPLELTAGPAEIAVRLRANGYTSEPDKEKAVITDSKSNDSAHINVPHLTNIGAARIGVGQLIQLMLTDVQWLDPDPLKTLVIVEQGGRRMELKPEGNSARYSQRDNRMMPVMLTARVGNQFIGEVTVRVYNPARGEQAGMSEGTTIEIVNQVLPPVLKRVTEAAKQDIAMLSAMREQALKVQREFPEYDPRARYVTIQATDLDPNPNFIRIQFQQGDKAFTLKFEDYSLVMGDRWVVRLPDEIKPGPVQVTIQNKSMGRFSEQVSATFEVKQPSIQ